MISRRAFLSGSAAVYIGSRYRMPAADSLVVNDIHSQLNETHVNRILTPRSVSDLQAAVRDARVARQPLSIAGGRHAMGGQQFGAATVLLDMRQMSRVLEFNPETGTLEVEAGAFWPEVTMVFLKGHKTRLKVSSSNFPRFARNLNAKTDSAAETSTASSAEIVHHGQGFPSRLILPVVPAQ